MSKILNTARKIDEMQRLIGDLQQDILVNAERFRNICYKALNEHSTNLSVTLRNQLNVYIESIYKGPLGDFDSRAFEVNHVGDDDIIAINFVDDDDCYSILYFTPASLEADTMEQEAVRVVDDVMKEFVEYFRKILTRDLAKWDAKKDNVSNASVLNTLETECEFLNTLVAEVDELTASLKDNKD